MEFPIHSTKVKGLGRSFDLTDPKEQEEYFEAKAGEEIGKLKNYLKEKTFIGYFLGKKNSGKGTYSKIFQNLVGPDKLEHFSVGDMVRGLDEKVENPEEKQSLVEFLKASYRGFTPVDEIVASLENRSTQTLLPTELILALTKKEIGERGGKALFIDGFPRNFDQVSYSLFFRDLVGYRDDPDFFVLISVPTSVIDERIKWRRVCPVCQTSRNLKLLTTSKVGYRRETNEFYLLCDNPHCTGENTELVAKEGDELGTEPIKERLSVDEQIMEKADQLYGIPKVYLRNTVPVSGAPEAVDEYEITPEYVYEYDESSGEVKTTERPWVVKDDEGVDSYSLLPHAVVVSLLKQTVRVLGL